MKIEEQAEKMEALDEREIKSGEKEVVFARSWSREESIVDYKYLIT